MIVIGVDPGKMTGISVVEANEGTDPSLTEYQIIDYGAVHSRTVGNEVESIVRTYGYTLHDLHLVVERFVPERTPRGFDATPIEVIGEIKALIRNAAFEWTEQVESVTWALRVEKERVDNKVLRRLGLHVRNKDVSYPDADDVNDATRHVVNRLVALGHRPTMEKGWPNE